MIPPGRKKETLLLVYFATLPRGHQTTDFLVEEEHMITLALAILKLDMSEWPSGASPFVCHSNLYHILHEDPKLPSFT